jgi:PhnB protein
VGHAELRIGNAILMLSSEYPEMGVRSPKSIGGSPVTISLYVDDVDSFTARAVAAGIKIVRPVENQFYGDRGGKFEDPFGHSWWFASRIEDMSPAEMKARASGASDM